MYYNPELLADDEVTMRHTFTTYSDAHDRNKNLIRLGFFAGYIPLTYRLSRTIRAPGLALYTLGFLGVH